MLLQTNLALTATLDNDTAIYLYVAASQDNINDQLTLLPCDDLDHSALHSFRDYEKVAATSKTLQAVESCVLVWIKQIRQVLFSSL